MPQSSFVLSSDHLQNTSLLFPHPYTCSLFPSRAFTSVVITQAAVGLCSEERWQLAQKDRSLLKPVIQKAMLTTILPSLRYKTKPIGVVYPGKHVKPIFFFQLNLHGVIHKQRTSSIEDTQLVIGNSIPIQVHSK